MAEERGFAIDILRIISDFILRITKIKMRFGIVFAISGAATVLPLDVLGACHGGH